MRIALIISIILLQSIFVLGKEEKPVDSKIETVTVYRQRAMIHRKASVNLSKGDHLLVFSGLSQYIIPNSVTVSGSGNGIIQSVKHRISYLNTTKKPARMIMIEDSLEILQEALNIQKDDRFVYEQEQDLLLKNNQLSGKEKSLSAEELQSVADLYRQRLTAIRAKLRTIRLQEQKLQKRVQAYKNELQQVRSQRQQPTQEVVVAFQSTTSGKVELELNYLVNGANWTPFYDIRVENTSDPLNFYLKAQVINQTGMDWKDVNIRLSTTNSAQNSVAPDLSPWYVDIGYPRQELRRLEEQTMAREKSDRKREDERMQKLAMANTMEMNDMPAPVAKPSAGYASDYTTVSQGELGLEFEISIPYDIPADGKEYQVDIQQMEVLGTYQHFAVPKLERDVFLVAEIRKDLLRGKANVYFEGTFVGETYVNTDNPRDSMKISLGRDAKVQVQREKIQDLTDRKVIGSTEKQTFGFETTVKNNKTSEVTLVLEDQVPVSRNKDIKVEMIEQSGGNWDENTGKIVWSLTLKPGETRQIKLQFELKYPKNKPISGI